MSIKTLDEAGLALADELAELVRDAIAEARDEDVVRPEIDALERYDAWRAQPKGEALPELNKSQREQYDWWRGAAAAIPGFMVGRLDSAADRLEREAQAAREKASELEPVIAHLRADARRAEQ